MDETLEKSEHDENDAVVEDVVETPVKAEKEVGPPRVRFLNEKDERRK